MTNENGPRRAAGAAPFILIDDSKVSFSEAITSFHNFLDNHVPGTQGIDTFSDYLFGENPIGKDMGYFLRTQRCLRVRDYENGDLPPDHKSCHNCPPLGVVVSACIIEGILCGHLVRSFYASVCEWESLLQANDNGIRAFLMERGTRLFWWEGLS
jgi:hypothetical protein